MEHVPRERPTRREGRGDGRWAGVGASPFVFRVLSYHFLRFSSPSPFDSTRVRQKGSAFYWDRYHPFTFHIDFSFHSFSLSFVGKLTLLSFSIHIPPPIVALHHRLPLLSTSASRPFSSPRPSTLPRLALPLRLFSPLIDCAPSLIHNAPQRQRNHPATTYPRPPSSRITTINTLNRDS